MSLKKAIPILLRPAVMADQPRLEQIAQSSKAHWGYSESFMRACREELAAAANLSGAGRCGVVAASGGEIVAFYVWERRSADAFELEALFVEPNWIGRGIGRRLMDDAKASARAAGARELIIQGDPNAEAFYLAAGAVRVGERASASIPGRMLPEFRIDLA